VLARLGAEGEGDVTPRVEAGCRRRQMQHDPTHRDDHVDAQLEELLAQPRICDSAISRRLVARYDQ
jgi:hypothetical protein